MSRVIGGIAGVKCHNRIKRRKSVSDGKRKVYTTTDLQALSTANAHTASPNAFARSPNHKRKKLLSSMQKDRIKGDPGISIKDIPHTHQFQGYGKNPRCKRCGEKKK